MIKRSGKGLKERGKEAGAAMMKRRDCGKVEAQVEICWGSIKSLEGREEGSRLKGGWR